MTSKKKRTKSEETTAVEAPAPRKRKATAAPPADADWDEISTEVKPPKRKSASSLLSKVAEALKDPKTISQVAESLGADLVEVQTCAKELERTGKITRKTWAGNVWSFQSVDR